MLGLNVFAADTDAEARLLFTSLQQAFVNLRTGRAGRLPPPVENYEAELDPMAQAMLGQALSCAVVGSPETVRQGIDAFVAPHRRRRADGHRADLRPRRARALVRDPGRRAPGVVEGGVRARSGVPTRPSMVRSEA